MTTEMKTSGIATALRIVCVSSKCCFKDYSDPPAPAEVPCAQHDLRSRTTDYAANVLYVLSNIASGNGGTEAQRTLGFLGLPNSTTMKGRTFGIIERRLAPVINGLFAEIMQENLEKEVHAHYRKEALAANTPFDQAKYDRWRAASNGTGPDILPADHPSLTAGTDMGWQCRKQLLSGHAFMVGMLLRKPLAWWLYSKHCAGCKRRDINGNIPPHEDTCVKNYNGSSKSMEPNAVLQMYIQLYRESKVTLGMIVSDDDTSMRAKLKWNNKIGRAHV